VRLVLDSSAALRACQSAAARRDLDGHTLTAPPLLWSEVHSAVHAAIWRKEMSDTDGRALLVAFGGLGVERRAPRRLYAEAFDIASELGWARTYDAEFLALARIERGHVLTTDGRLRRGADRTGLVLSPAELRSR
jgi:predicted nucleic acid-binding protein